MHNTQYPLLSNQHNGDDAPQDLKAQVFTHTLPDINSLKNAIRQQIANVTQGTVRRVMASVPGRWQQCLECHAGHLQDVVLKT